MASCCHVSGSSRKVHCQLRCGLWGAQPWGRAFWPEAATCGGVLRNLYGHTATQPSWPKSTAFRGARLVLSPNNGSHHDFKAGVNLQMNTSNDHVVVLNC